MNGQWLLAAQYYRLWKFADDDMLRDMYRDQYVEARDKALRAPTANRNTIQLSEVSIEEAWGITIPAPCVCPDGAVTHPVPGLAIWPDGKVVHVTRYFPMNGREKRVTHTFPRWTVPPVAVPWPFELAVRTEEIV